ncbi:beta strand repeat-containing protein [Echinicola rosea]|uniref:beta strand repeat-containing protein n=1 Tax=Echinicola rosea TaxID=1807691 RepID=UPI0010CA6EF4|nr:hypothetical protein [Echinicola rosea]
MKRVILLAFCLVMGSTAMAQVGIGTEDPNMSSQLEVVASDRGILIPQVALEDITDESTITDGNVESLLVFNITDNDMIVPGYYYWYDGKWRRLAWSGGSPASNNMLVYDQEADRFYYNDENGDLVPLDISELLDETVSTLENNGNGTFTYTDEQGNESMIDIPSVVATNISEDGNVYAEIMALLERQGNGNVTYDQTDGTFTYIDESGAEQVIDWSDFNTINNSFTVENDSLTVTDSEGDKVQLSLEEVAGNSAFITTISNNSEFIDEITQLLEEDFGNVTYDQTDGTFTYIDESGAEQVIDWSDFNTINNSFTVENDSLTVTDSEGDKVQLSLEEVAANSAFITTISNNSEFIDEITQLLEEDFGNVTYDQTDGTFTYIDESGAEQVIDWSDFNTINNSFTVENDSLTVTDSEGDKVQLSLEEVAANSAFITTISNNSEFIDEITQLLEEDFGNVTYDQTDGTFTYIDESGAEQVIDWSDFNTINNSFTVENDSLTVTDSEGDKVQLSLEEVAANSAFITTISNNSEFIDEITQLLEEDFGNVTYDQTDGTFTYIDDSGAEQVIDWSDFNTINNSFTVENDSLTVTDSEGDKVQVSLDEIANNSSFINTLTSNSDFINEIETVVAASSDELVDNGDGTFTHTAGDGTTITFDANTTTLADNGDGTYTLTNANGDTITIDVVGDVLTELQDNSSSIYTEVNTIVANNDTNTTNASLTEDGTNLILTDSEGGIVQLALADLADDIDTNTTNSSLTQDGTDLILTDSEGGTVTLALGDIDTNTTNASLTEDGTNLILTDSEGGIVQLALADLADDIDTNTTNSSLTEDGTDLILTDSEGGTVTLALGDIDTNTTNASLTEDGTNLILTDSEGGTVQLALADLADDIDTNTTNSSLTEDGTDLILTDSEGGTVTLALGDIDTNTTNASLTEDGTNLILTDSEGGTVQLALADLADDIDTNTTNSSLTEDGTDLILTDSEGGTVTLALGDIDTNTTNASLTEDGTNLILTDSEGGTVQLALADLADDIDTDNQQITDLSISGGALSTTIEDGNTQSLDLISIDAGNTIVAGTDGALYVPSSTLNIYNTDGTLPGLRTVSGTENWLRFQGTDGLIEVNGDNLRSSNTDGNQINLEFSGNTARLFADGPTMDAFNIGMTTGFAQPLNFITNGGTRLTIDDAGELQFHNYLNSRDNSGATPVENILYTDASGNVLSADVSVVQSQQVHYRSTSQDTGKEWLNNEPVFEVVADITLASNTNLVDLSGSDIPTGATLISVRFVSKSTGSISTNIIEYDDSTRQLILGTAGSMTTLHPAGDYYIIVEYVVEAP